MAALRITAALALAFAIAGCAQLLPKSQAEVSSPWHSFDDAKAVIEAIVPGQSTSADLRALGIDPYASPNVQLLNYSDIVLRFPIGTSVAAESLDSGLRECLQAGKACTGYVVTARDTQRDRVGNFWQDAFHFKRIVDVKGWSFNALILVVGERVVYTLYGGQPNVHEQEITRQPLGPLQNWGDSIPLKDLGR